MVVRTVGLCLLLAVSALGQQPNTFGTSQVAYTIGFSAFTPTESTQAVHQRPAGFGVYSDGTLTAPLSLPAGALLELMQIDACGFPGGNITARLYECLNDLCFIDKTLSIDTVNGCFITQGSVSAVTIDNAGKSYFVSVNFNPSDGSVWLNKVRFSYSLQVSPAPGTATFTDVPTTHPFFQFIEALSASGITAGCVANPPQFCPNAPLTRGQMAVFLSRALGLHFAP